MCWDVMLTERPAHRMLLFMQCCHESVLHAVPAQPKPTCKKSDADVACMQGGPIRRLLLRRLAAGQHRSRASRAAMPRQVLAHSMPQSGEGAALAASALPQIPPVPRSSQEASMSSPTLPQHPADVTGGLQCCVPVVPWPWHLWRQHRPLQGHRRDHMLQGNVVFGTA